MNKLTQLNALAIAMANASDNKTPIAVPMTRLWRNPTNTYVPKNKDKFSELTFGEMKIMKKAAEKRQRKALARGIARIPV